MAYILTLEDLQKLSAMGVNVNGVPEGAEATPEEMAALGVTDPTAIKPTNPEIPVTGPNDPNLKIAPDGPAAAAPMAAQPAGGINTAGLLDLAQPVQTDPYENLSRDQRMMIGFAAIKDAGMALQGKEGNAVKNVMSDIADRADRERKRQAALAQRQMMSQLMGGGLTNLPQDQLIMLAAQGLIDPAIVGLVSEERKRVQGVEQEVAQKRMMIDQIDALLFDPDLGSALGIEGFLRKKPAELGLDENAARVWGRINQIKGGAFLQAFESLKGGGQITELEGQKAEQAQTRLETAQSEKDFKEALQEYKFYIDQGIKRLEGQQIPPDTLYGQGAKADPLGIRN